MDEEALRNDFFEWLENVFEPRLRAEKRMRWNDCSVEAWLEATRRADRKARLECERIALQYSQAYGQTDDAMAIARGIRATIKEE